jgi:UDP-2-acetamido-3-amino-2,3-dideoxy-glucuronate N-acetyltransferase
LARTAAAHIVPSMSKRLVALAGLGAWGRHHLRVLASLGRLGPTFDPDPQAARRAPSTHRAASFAELLTDPGVEAVVLATPARTHHDLARRALDAGKHVLVEKPLTLNEADGRSLVELALARGLVLMVGHITLFHPGVVELRRLLRTGVLGSPRYLYSNRLNLGTVREEEDILWSFAPHDVAVLLDLLQAWPERVWAVGGSWLRPDRADVTVTHLDFGAGRLAHIFVSWLHAMKEHRLVVLGEERMAVFTDSAKGGELRLCRADPAAAAGRSGEGELQPFAAAEPLREEIEHFLDCVATGREPRSGGRHGLGVLRVLETARQSMREGGVPLDCPPLETAVG